MPLPLLLLMFIAPASVVLALLLFHDVFAVFALYHLGICLILPLAADLAGARLTLNRHLAHLGLTGPGTGRAIGLGLGLSVLVAGSILGIDKLWGEQLLAGNAVGDTLTAWGAPPDRHGALFVFMALVNGPAEELFWRGFIAAEIPRTAPRAARLLVPSFFYASYHAVTVMLLVPVPAVAALMFTAVGGAGVFWAWLRERTGSVWPALLSHGCASLAYMLVARPLLSL